LQEIRGGLIGENRRSSAIHDRDRLGDVDEDRLQAPLETAKVGEQASVVDRQGRPPREL
jgi:hypothetical protein